MNLAQYKDTYGTLVFDRMVKKAGFSPNYVKKVLYCKKGKLKFSEKAAEAISKASGNEIEENSLLISQVYVTKGSSYRLKPKDEHGHYI